MRDTNLALMADKEIQYEEDGEILFATPQRKATTKRLVASGVMRAGEPTHIDVADELFVGAMAKALTFEAAIGRRAAEAGLIPDGLSVEAAEAHAQAVQERHDDINAFADMLATDTGKGSHMLGYSMAGDQSTERRQVIIDQVRLAKNQDELNKALDAAYFYEPSVYQCMRSQYGDKFQVATNG